MSAVPSVLTRRPAASSIPIVQARADAGPLNSRHFPLRFMQLDPGLGDSVTRHPRSIDAIQRAHFRRREQNKAVGSTDKRNERLVGFPFIQQPDDLFRVGPPRHDMFQMNRFPQGNGPMRRATALRQWMPLEVLDVRNIRIADCGTKNIQNPLDRVDCTTIVRKSGSKRLFSRFGEMAQCRYQISWSVEPSHRAEDRACL